MSYDIGLYCEIIKTNRCIDIFYIMAEKFLWHDLRFTILHIK